LKKTKSISGQVGQLLIVGFDGTEMSSHLRSLLTRLQPAGVILFARNIISGEQTHKLLKECRACVSTPLFTCVDMEGGKVDRFRNVTGPAPSAADVFASRNPRLYRKHGRTIGEACRALGFNLDFAPVVDLAFKASRNVMSSRAVSADPKEATAYAREFLAGLRSAGVLGAIKHFPGLGEANLDTHHELPSVDKPWKKLWAADIAPYVALRRESPLVLVGHAAYPAVTHDRRPASLSKKWITDILRKKIGYRGLVVSDDLEMGGVLKAAPIERAAVEHIRAGGDLCLICHIE
jgi:beta-N-acetylhexosaminidase